MSDLNWLWRTWNAVIRWLHHRRWLGLDCPYCLGRDDFCNCGAGDLDWEVTGGAHYMWCSAYNGCPWCWRGD